MIYYMFRRILMLPPVMLIVAFIVFGLLYVTPGDPAAMIAGDQATPEEVERIRIGMGLDQPFYLRFGYWICILLSVAANLIACSTYLRFWLPTVPAPVWVVGIGIGLWGVSRGQARLAALGFSGGFLHLWNHALMKGLMFLCAGSVMHGAGTRDRL